MFEYLLQAANAPHQTSNPTAAESSRTRTRSTWLPGTVSPIRTATATVALRTLQQLALLAIMASALMACGSDEPASPLETDVGPAARATTENYQSSGSARSIQNRETPNPRQDAPQDDTSAGQREPTPTPTEVPAPTATPTPVPTATPVPPTPTPEPDPMVAVVNLFGRMSPDGTKELDFVPVHDLSEHNLEEIFRPGLDQLIDMMYEEDHEPYRYTSKGSWGLSIMPQLVRNYEWETLSTTQDTATLLVTSTFDKERIIGPVTWEISTVAVIKGVSPDEPNAPHAATQLRGHFELIPLFSHLEGEAKITKHGEQ